MMCEKKELENRESDVTIKDDAFSKNLRFPNHRVSDQQQVIADEYNQTCCQGKESALQC